LRFLGASVVVMTFLFVGSYHTAAISATHKAGKSKFVLPFSLFLAPFVHCLLNRIKKFLGNNWLMRSLINFVVELKHSIVEMIFECLLDTGNRKRFVAIACYSVICQKLLYGF